MKKPLPLLLLLSLIFLPLCGAKLPGPMPPKNPRGYYDFPRFIFTAKKGNWNQGRNWWPEKVPEGIIRIEIKGGSTVTVSKPTTLIGPFAVGVESAAKTTLIMEREAQITCASMALPANFENADTTLVIEGGELIVGKDIFNINGMLQVGNNITYSGMGRLEISGGKLTAGVKVGSDVANTNKGIFVVKGSQPQIAPHSGPNNAFFVYESGTLEFVLDENGVAPLNYKRAKIWLYNNATLRVEGSAYRGPAKTIPLIECDQLTVQDIKQEITGFSAPYTATVSFDGKRAVLKISR